MFVIDAVRAAIWTQNNLSTIPLDIRDRFKHEEMPGPVISMYTAWRMFKAYAGYSGMTVEEALEFGAKHGFITYSGVYSRSAGQNPPGAVGVDSPGSS